jgi:membrane protein
MLNSAWARAETLSRRAREWADQQHPGSLKGVAVDGWRRYRLVEGALQSALLSLYVLVAVVPALLVMEEYLNHNPTALTHRLAHHFGLNHSTVDLLQNVLADDRTHKLGSALFAIAGALFFGLNFGRVLQLVHIRAWKLDLRPRGSDIGVYSAVLVAVYGLLLLLLVTLTELHGLGPTWARILLDLGFLTLLVAFFVWAPWFLTHQRLKPRDLLPGAILTALGLIALLVASSFLIEYWVNLHARDYGGFGVVLALYFWMLFGSGLIIWAAAVSPALAERRNVRRRV